MIALHANAMFMLPFFLPPAASPHLPFKAAQQFFLVCLIGTNTKLANIVRELQAFQ